MRPDELNHINLPQKSSHKGQNGRLLIIGGSQLFHAASLWALQVASRIVDLVHYSSIPENNQLVHELKREFRNGIIVPRSEIESYIEEDDVILIGPGMVRAEGTEVRSSKFEVRNLQELERIKDEGEQTAALTNYLLQKYPRKQWVIDAGALQMMDVDLIPKKAILTPHARELDNLYLKSISENPKSEIRNPKQFSISKKEIQKFAKNYKCLLLVKGEIDIVSDGKRVEEIKGGNAGMTKGGTGDVLAGLIAALACKNDPWDAAIAGSFINKAAGDSLYKKVGYFFNASDLASEIPKVMKRLLIDK